MSRRPLTNIWVSYGCQLAIINFLSDLEVVPLQLINRESYERTIGRCQYSFHLPKKMIAFTFPIYMSKELDKCIILLDGMTGEVQKFENDRLDFANTHTVVVEKKLYAFKYGNPVSAYKIADFTSTHHLVTTLSTLPHDEYLIEFAVSYWVAAGSIVLTGGLTHSIS